MEGKTKKTKYLYVDKVGNMAYNYIAQKSVSGCRPVGRAPALGLRERFKPLLLKNRINTGFFALSNLDFLGLTLYLTTTVELDFSRFL